MDACIELINSMGRAFVGFAWPMLLQSSMLIVVLLLADYLLHKKVRAVFRYWLWMLVLVKLVLPTSLSSPVSMGCFTGEPIASINISGNDQPVAGDILPSPVVSAASEPSLEMPYPVSADIQPTEPAIHQGQPAVSLAWQGGVLLVWLAVVIAMVLLLLQRAVFVCGLVRQSSKANNEMKDTLRFCSRTMGINKAIGLKVSPNATSPAVCGLFRPVILLPHGLDSNLDSNQLKVVLMHELAHIKRGDLWVNLVQTLLQIAYFYNPMLWLANWIIRRMREQAVDEAVQVALGEKAQQYPETLLNVARLAFERPALSLRLVGVVESRSALAGRIKRILTRPIPKTAKLGVIGSVAIILLASILLPMAKAAKTDVQIAKQIESTKTPFTAKLSGGVTIEIVCVSNYPDNTMCWRPDGSQSEEKLFVKVEENTRQDNIGFVAKISGPDDMSISYGPIEGAEGHSGHDRVVGASGEVLNGYTAMKATIPEARDSTTVTFGISTSAWKTLATHTGRSATTTGSKMIIFSQAFETEDFVGLTISSKQDRTRAERIVAFDKNNQIKTADSVSSLVSNDIDQLTVKFYGLKLEDILEFAFQTRPYEWVEFKGVSLKPGVKQNVEVKTAEKARAYGIEVYEVNRNVAEFEKEDFSTPEAAYASINRISASGEPSGWQLVSVKELAERLAKESKSGKIKVEPEWAQVLLNAKILEVQVCDSDTAVAIAKLPQKFSSRPIRKPIDIRHLKLENGRWLNAGNDRVWTIEEARAQFDSQCDNRQKKNSVDKQAMNPAKTVITAAEFGDDNSDKKRKGPPVVVKTSPETYADDVSPDLNKLSVTFNQQMADKSWSWVRWDAPYPETTGSPYYDKEMRTCTLPVKLEPGKAYLVAFNIEPYLGFRNEAGQPARPYVLVFATKDKDGKPTPIPEELIAKAKSVNETVQKTSSKPGKEAGETGAIPYTQVTYDEIRPDGTIFFKNTIRVINKSGKAVTTQNFINSDFVHVTAMTDSDGRDLKFKSTHDGDIYRYEVIFNKPVSPGGLIEYTSEGTMEGLVKPVSGRKDTFQYYMKHWPAAGQPTQRIETYLLPAGAELISTMPKDMERKEKNGRIELHVEKLIPPGGSITTSFRYHLPEG